jgi:predicted PolB exonuclease-like 3'-5' exonuclease
MKTIIKIYTVAILALVLSSSCFSQESQVYSDSEIMKLSNYIKDLEKRNGIDLQSNFNNITSVVDNNIQQKGEFSSKTYENSSKNCYDNYEVIKLANYIKQLESMQLNVATQINNTADEILSYAEFISRK